MTEHPRPSLTVVTVAGIEVVTIPLAHYAELLDCQRRLALGEVTPLRFVADLRSRIDRDPEVANFLTECFGRMLLKDAAAGCRERFGATRAPGKSTIQRFWARLREAPGMRARLANRIG